MILARKLLDGSAALVIAASLGACGGEAQRTGAKDPPLAEAHRAKMDTLWSPARRARLSKAVRGASRAFTDDDVARLDERVSTWTDAWVRSAAEVDAAAHAGRLDAAHVAASRACLEVERIEYGALLDGLNRACREPGCQAERVSNLDWQLIEAEQSTRACPQPAFAAAYLESNLAEPEALDTLGHFLALEALGDEARLGRSLEATLARHTSPSPFRTRLLLLEGRRLLRSENRPAEAIVLLDAGLAEANARGDELEAAALRTARSDANHRLLRLPEAQRDAALALEHSERALGSEHVETALARASLGAVSSELDVERAAIALDRARLTLTRGLGPTHALTARIELALGQLEAHLGDAGASQRWLTRGTSSTAVAFGAQHLAMSDAVRCNAEAESALGNTRTGVALFDRALQIDLRILGQVHPRVASGWAALGASQERAGQPLPALGSYEKSLAVAQRLPEPQRRSLTRDVCTRIARLPAEVHPAPAAASCADATEAER
ncbi:MAG: hypothetical protein R3B89_22715 [Polyangiaceae bacterium]